MMTEKEKVQMQAKIAYILNIPTDDVCFMSSPVEGNENVVYFIRTPEEDVMLGMDQFETDEEIIRALNE